MKILVVHNTYQQRGGEDGVVAAEINQLLAHGDTVARYGRNNAELRAIDTWTALEKGAETLWSRRTYDELTTLIARERPDIAHFHNTFPLISPSGYYACTAAGVPVVQTLHNYRLLCPAATLLRDGQICETCVGRSVPWPGVRHACYRGSIFQSAALAAMLFAHRTINTWRNKVNTYIALSEFARQKFVQGGLPADRIVVKPNFVDPDPGKKLGIGDYALFVGRLSDEKGWEVLLEAWRRLTSNIPLHLLGDGPMRKTIQQRISQLQLPNIKVVGTVSQEEVSSWMRGARFLVCPSLWYEGFPLAIAEAFACGLPVIASRLGSLAEIVEDGRTGLHFTPGVAQDLARTVEWAWCNEAQLKQMGWQARVEFERKYSAEENYNRLIHIYSQLAAQSRVPCAGRQHPDGYCDEIV
jgi:glycosyltransferase involved in cell wall biosynthesis